MTEPLHIVCPHCSATNRVPSARLNAAKCGGCHAPLFNGHPTPVDEATLDRHVRRNDIPVLVDIWAPWCGPCRSMAPQFERAAAALEPNVRLLKLDADSAQATCGRLGVRGIPALFLFRNGTVVGQTAGAMDARAITHWVQGALAAA